LGYWKIVEDN